MEIYILLINAISFLIYTIDFLMYSQKNRRIGLLFFCNLIILSGGALGAMIAIFLWHGDASGFRPQFRIFTAFWLIVHIVLYISYYCLHQNILYDFYRKYNLLCIYIFVINILTFIIYAVDKFKARIRAWRIREIILLALAFLGGAFGAWVAMDLCNHKVRSMHFMIGVPLMMVLHMMILFWITVGTA